MSQLSSLPLRFARVHKNQVAGLLASAVLLAICGSASAAPTLPSINTNNVITITNAPYNAVGDGITTNTATIQAAINAAAIGGTTNGLKGGTVRIPPGIFLSGPLIFSNCINLQIDAGAILRMLPYGSYPGSASFLGATNVNDVEISGSGAVDGQGYPWWSAFETNSSLARPIMVRFQGCNRQLIQGVTLSNSPMFHITISSSKGNATVQGVTIRAPASSATPASHNTDACDVSGTNILVQNCDISTGDDDFTCSGGTWDVLLTNNVYGEGHGVSIGSYTDGGVSNITVANCTFNSTDNGLRIKSDTGRGGLVQNIFYHDISMTNVNFPIQLYAYYLEVGTPSSITPYYAATQQVDLVTTTTPFYRNITYSNITATAVSGYPAAIIWARTEAPATNIIFKNVNITASRPFEIYNATQVLLSDCVVTQSQGSNTFSLYDAQVTVTNSAPSTRLVLFDGITTNGYGNSLALYNSTASLNNTNCFDDGPLTLGASTLSISNNFTMFPSTVLNYALGTNAATVRVVGNLTSGGTVNVTAGAGFTNGSYLLFTNTGSLNWTAPTLGSAPSGYNYSWNTATPGQVSLVVQLPPAGIPTNLVATASNALVSLKWNASSNSTSYNVKRGTTSGSYPTVFSGITTTNYSDTAVTNGVTYYYVVSGVNSTGESANSTQVSATPQPSLVPTNITVQVVGNQLQLSWPADHTGWKVQIQTNSLASGIGTNWTTLPATAGTNQYTVPIYATNPSVFVRLVYP